MKNKESKITNNSKENARMFFLKALPPLTLFSLFLLLSTIAFAIPNSLTLQGKLTNLAGSSQTGTFNFTFKIYDNAAGGNELWAVINQSVTTDANGVYDVILNGINLSFAEQYYLGISVQGENESVPRVNLTSAPYSFRANTSEALNPNASYFVTNLSIGGNATIGSGITTLEISTQTFNLTKTGLISTAGNITLSEQIRFRFGQTIDNIINGFLRVTGNLNVTGNASIAQDTLFVDNTSRRVGIGTTTPNDALEVIGNVRISGSLNATFINATEIRQGANLVQTVNAVFNIGNLTGFFGDSGFNGSVLRTGNISNIRESLWNRVNLTDFFGDASFNSSVLRTGNISTIFRDNNGSLWNASGSNIYTKDANSNVGIGTASPGQALHVVGSANISQTLNAPVLNTTRADQNITISSGGGSVIIRLG